MPGQSPPPADSPAFLIWIITPGQGAGINAAVGGELEADDWGSGLFESGAVDDGEHVAIQRVEFDAGQSKILTGRRTEPACPVSSVPMAVGDLLLRLQIANRAERLVSMTELENFPPTVFSDACRLLRQAIDAAEARWGETPEPGPRPAPESAPFLPAPVAGVERQKPPPGNEDPGLHPNGNRRQEDA